MPIIKSRRKYSPDNILRQIWPIEIALSTYTATLYVHGGFSIFVWLQFFESLGRGWCKHNPSLII